MTTRKDEYWLREYATLVKIEWRETISLWWRLRRPSGNRLALVLVLAVIVIGRELLWQDLSGAIVRIAIGIGLAGVIAPVLGKRLTDRKYSGCHGPGLRLIARCSEDRATGTLDQAEYFWIARDGGLMVVKDGAGPTPYVAEKVTLALGSARGSVRGIKFDEEKAWRPARQG